MHANITGLILAGGKGSRMDHLNKGLVEFKGKPLIQHVIDRLSPQLNDIVISANSDLDRYRKFGYRVVEDLAGSDGPLSGIHSCAATVNSELLFITACDMPFLPMDIISKLIDTDFDEAVMAKSARGVEPLACLVRKSAITKIATLPKGQGFSVYKWLEICNAKGVDIQAEQNAFMNINSTNELDAMEYKN